ARGAGLHDAGLRLRRATGQRRRLQRAVPVRHHADVPVLRHLLPGEPAARRARGGGVADPAVARRRSVPRPGAGDGHPAGFTGARGLPAGVGDRRPVVDGHQLPEEVAHVSAPTKTRPGALVHTLARALPVPAGAGMARALVERNVRAFRHGWVTLVSGFFEPMFYLFSLGVGLGALIGDVDTGGGRMIDYAVYVAPGMMAAAAMNGAVFDSTFNVFFKLKYAKLYDSVLATPLGPRDVAVGEISWALLRGLLYSTAFLVVAT